MLVRQVLGAAAEFEKTTLVAKLAAARKYKATGKRVEGRKSHAEKRPEVVALAKALARKKAQGREIEPAGCHGGNGGARRPERARVLIQPEVRCRRVGRMTD